jgi:hypothetical protein
MPALEPLRARRGRRQLVVAYVVVLLSGPAVGWVTASMGPVLPLAILYLVGAVLLGVATGGVLDRPIRSLDERQQQVRLTLVPDPYVTGATLGLLGGLLVALAVTAGDGPMLGLLLLAGGGLYGLPAMLLAWKLPDRVDDEG